MYVYILTEKKYMYVFTFLINVNLLLDVSENPGIIIHS